MDLRDAAALLEISEREVLVREVESRIGGVRPDVRAPAGNCWRARRDRICRRHDAVAMGSGQTG